MSNALDFYVVYHDPTDFPGKFVVRKQSLLSGGDLFVSPNPEIVCDSLQEARRAVPSYLFRLDRHPNDVTSIVETWL